MKKEITIKIQPSGQKQQPHGMPYSFIEMSREQLINYLQTGKIPK